MVAPGFQRRAKERAPITCDCTLARRSGTPISCRTLDVGGGGMRILCRRPLAVDETLTFTFALGDGVLEGAARVLRMQGFNEYALRFEGVRPEALLVETLAS
jgi:c-di-GMP-binding flagellar brake protein YcgR